MERIKISGSSNIVGVGYDETDHILEIEFTTGGVYRYLDVKPNIYSAFIESSSKGTYFYQNIKGHYGCVKG
jgi:hypothetical protein